MQDGGTAPVAASTRAGFAPGKNAVATLGYYRGRWGASGTNSTGQAASWIDAQTGPVKGTGSTASNAGDSFITPTALTGTFAAGAWTLTFTTCPLTATLTGRLRMRIWASVNADGSSARELTAGALIGQINTQSSTTTDYAGGFTWSPGAITLNNEYLFFQIEWQETTAGSANGATTRLRVGTSLVTSTNFTAQNAFT